MSYETSRPEDADLDTTLRRIHPAASEAAALLRAPDLGEAGWWSRIADRGAPIVEPITADRVCVTFLWRDDQRDRVYIDVNSVTDHHSFAPEGLEQIPGSDVWFWQASLPPAWRGSYAFIPTGPQHRPPAPMSEAAARWDQQRDWWRSISALARPDPLNPVRPHPSGWDGQASGLHLPQAPDQSMWAAVDAGQPPPSDPARGATFEWRSAIQGKGRTVWLHLTDEPGRAPAGGYPLAILLDGRNWIERMPLPGVLDAETRAGRLPPAVYLFVDSIDGAHREQDLPCNPAFWRAVQDELLPLASQFAPLAREPERTVVAGQSYGGLSALYAGLHWPSRFGRVLSQSGSFWWPQTAWVDGSAGGAQARRPGARGWLARQVEAGGLPAGALRVFMEVGSREGAMLDVNETMRAALDQAGHHVTHRRFEGGHDSLCWRGGLVDGLRCLLAPTQETPS
ncbi:enterochelin esterase [Phenylobacterium sp. LjRoot225]|uniref:enterochelin esterase n=1 Tax=Phenylobacterium sp. LjRoot225 TaxID=3342285 RepID=UPI003ECE58FF